MKNKYIATSHIANNIGIGIIEIHDDLVTWELIGTITPEPRVSLIQYELENSNDIESDLIAYFSAVDSKDENTIKFYLHDFIKY